MIYRNTNFPILATRRVIVSNNNPSTAKVKVEFLIKSRESGSISRWFNDTFAEYSQYLKIYFMLLDDTSADLVGALAPIDTRYATLRSVRSNPTLALRYNLDTASVTFSEVLQNQSFSTTPVSDMSGDYYHDIYSEIEINIGEVDLATTNKLHLIGFIHMDAERYYRDKGIAPNPQSNPIERRGGELIYDLLLERGQESLEVPQFRQVLYLESTMESGTTLEPYYGPSHYHSEDNPSETGYVGWMAGTETNMGPPLQARRVRNYKVVADVYGMQSEEELAFSSRIGFPVSPAGDFLDEYVSSIVDREEILDSSRKLAATVAASDFSEGIKKNSFIKMSDVPMSCVRSYVIPDPETGEMTNRESHHAVIVGIDYYRLVRGQSAYGDLLHFHKEKGNLPLVSELLLQSKIISLMVTRERLVTTPHHFAEASSIQYTRHDMNEPEKKLVISSDGPIRPSGDNLYPYKNFLVESSTEAATISEIDLVQPVFGPNNTMAFVPIDFSRNFMIKDRDLFHNIQTGKHRHNMSFIIEDGVYKYIRNLSSTLNTTNRQFSKYYSDAQQPVIKTKEGIYQSGNYDYVSNDFHQTFKDRNYNAVIESALNSYVKSVLFLTGNPVSQAAVTNLRLSLNPKNTNLQVLGDFNKRIEILLSSMNDILEQTGEFQANYETKKQKKTNVSASGPGRKSRTIEVKAKGVEVIQAISEGTVLANYAITAQQSERGEDITTDIPNMSILDYSNRAVQFPGRVSDVAILPASYISFASSPFSTNEALGQQVNSSLPAARKGYNRIGSSLSKTLSTFQSFRTLKGNGLNNQILKINSLRSKENIDSGLVNKDPASFVYAGFSTAGIAINSVSNLSSVGFGAGIRIDKPSATKQELKNLVLNMKLNNVLELTDELKATLQAAALTGVSRAEVLSIVEDNYFELNQIIDSIGGVYSSMAVLAGSMQSMAAKISSTGRKAATEKDKFSESSVGTTKAGFGLKTTMPYQAEKSSFSVVTPGLESKNISLKQMSSAEEVKQGNEIEKYIFLKIKPEKSDDGIVSVNDGYLLRV